MIKFETANDTWKRISNLIKKKIKNDDIYQIDMITETEVHEITKIPIEKNTIITIRETL